MSSQKTLALIAICVCMVCASSVFAQGSANKGRGLGKAAERAAQASASGLQKAADAVQSVESGRGPGNQQIDRANTKVLRSAAGLEKAQYAWLRGWNQTTPAGMPGEGETSDVHDSSQSLENFERIRSQRMDRAEHLREIAEQNGNEHLLETADRMQASAETNFLRQTESLQNSPDEPNLNSGRQDRAASTIRSTPNRRRGFWIRSR